VLEAIKERGEIVTKIAYSDWKRVGDYSRLLTQHAIRMVQRNMTPGGDKNGADITMALDALEMAFTHDHINAFVIVGGDSDFISLVEKLKQYGRKVIVVGGRQFTSATMQRNCHEFIAYENLVGSRGGRQAERSGGRAVTGTGTSEIAKVLPLVKRALKVLSEREVTPQLGLLKSTLLQLDSTFSEREYGVSSFRDFMEKVAKAGAVTLKHAGRSMLVESIEDGSSLSAAEATGDASVLESADSQPAIPSPDPRSPVPDPRSPIPTQTTRNSLPASPMSLQDGIRAVQHAFTGRLPPDGRSTCGRPSSICAPPSTASTSGDTDSRPWSICSAPRGKRVCFGSRRDRQGAIRVSPGRTCAPKPALPVDEPEMIDIEEEAFAAPVDSGVRDRARCGPADCGR
jgi:hypothetical protein